DRTLRRVRALYDIFRPFIFEHSYLFKTSNTARESARLSPEDHARFGFDIDTLCWRHYWIDVQMPGLMKWSYPLMHGQKAPIDPPREEQLALLSQEAQRVARLDRRDDADAF